MDGTANKASNCDSEKQEPPPCLSKKSFYFVRRTKTVPLWLAFGSKENRYRKDLRKKVMKPDFTATKGRHAQNKNRERERGDVEPGGAGPRAMI